MTAPRIGVIGAGYWAAYQYLPYFRDSRDVHLVGVVRKDTTGLDAFRRAYDLDVATTSVDELLSAGVDGVVISSPHHLHREHAVAALRAGAHVLVEKPMALTLSDAREIGDVARTVERQVAVAHGWNWSRLVDWATEIVNSGGLGELRSVTGYMSSGLTNLFAGRSGYGVLDVDGFPVEAETATWADKGRGGGYLYGQLSHLLALALRLVPNEAEEVFARANETDLGVDTDIQLSVGFAGGLIGSFSGQSHEPPGRQHACDLRIAGERGVLMLDLDRIQAQLLTDDGNGEEGWLTSRPTPPACDDDAGYTCDGPTQFLIDACSGLEPANRAPAELGIRTVGVLEAASRSLATRRIVDLAELD